MRLNRLANSLLVAGINTLLVVLAFAFFRHARFTTAGGFLCVLILLLSLVDVLLVIRDLSNSGTRERALVAVLLWFPVLFLIAMIAQWEGPLYVAANGNPPHFEVRGLSGFCGLDIYGPEQSNITHPPDNAAIWSIENTPGQFPFEADFNYGDIPNGFVQKSGASKVFLPALDPNRDYKLVVSRCMGGPQYLLLHHGSISDLSLPLRTSNRKSLN